MRMNILWLGSINWFDEENGYIFPPRYAGEISGSAFEQAIIEGLESLSHDITIINDINDNNKVKWSHNNKSDDICINSVNIKYVNLLHKYVSFKHEIDKIKEKILESEILIVYGIYAPYLKIADYIKKLNKNIKYILICPDLSEYNDPAISRKKIKKFLKTIEVKYENRIMSQVDGLVLFAPNMKEKLPVNVPSIVVEGVYFDNLDEETDEDRLEKTVLYAGSLSANFGIQNIIKAIQIIKDPNVKLYIFGTGELENDIKKISKNDNRIKYYGFIDRNQLFEYEKKASLLINARDINEPFTKYSFPSKMFEYMVSGTAVMTTHLEGIPSDYDEYLVYIEDNSPETIAAGITKYFNTSTEYREEFGQKAKRFIKDNKNKYKQSEKINAFFQELLND